MRIAAITLTWNRPAMLGRLIHCFQQQTHDDRCMLILDDAGQYETQFGDGWALVSTPRRWPTLGDKRNAAVDMALRLFRGVDAMANWDDDDVYWPGALEATVAALEKDAWASARVVYETASPTGELKIAETFPRDRPLDFAYHGVWAWRKQDFLNTGGYPAYDSGEDGRMADVLRENVGPPGNSSPDKQPWYWYNREIPKMNESPNPYVLHGQETIQSIARIGIGWNGPDFYQKKVIPGIHPRVW